MWDSFYQSHTIPGASQFRQGHHALTFCCPYKTTNPSKAKRQTNDISVLLHKNTLSQKIDHVMKLFQAVPIGLVLLVGANRAGGTRLGGGENQPNDRQLTGAIEDKVLFFSDQIGDYSEKPCAQVVGGSNKVHVADCSLNPAGTIWTLESSGLLRNEVGGCMQAGHGELIQDGSHMRVKACDENEPFQKFMFASTNSDGHPSGDLTLQSNTNLCVTHATNEVKMGNNFLILKDCSVLSTKRRNWSFSYHVYDYLFSSGGAAYSALGINIKKENIDFGYEVTEHPAASWRMDEIGMIRNGYGECMQAGHGELVQDGTNMRVYPCDANSDFQKFRIRDEVWDPPEEINGNGRFKLQSNDDLCITVANDIPILIMKTCPPVNQGGGRWGWVLA